ncbi:uncharacterized protein [Parasteatoda tepidariorum]|uniref:uncharacterized protein n=1 Tax=Parasteatoda tepidariorum TaxID=114398 RepID=UPI0039BD1365
MKADRERTSLFRSCQYFDLNLSAFHYDSTNNYSLQPSVIIGKMDQLCTFRNALKFKNETDGICCSVDKVKPPDLTSPAEPFSTLLSGQTNHFLANIRRYNSCFQMTSVGATRIVNENYMPTFKVQGQIYHRAGSLLPLPGADHKFLQIYFMGNTNDQVNQRCQLNNGTKREIVTTLQNFFNQHNQLIRLFRTALDKMPSDNYKVVIRADKTPAGHHKGKYNAPTLDEVAVVIVDDEFTSRDIVLYRRNGDVQRVSETHRFYDALQYPILFWQGEDGYHFNIKLRNPQTGKKTNKKKRGLSHAHILIWLIEKITPCQTDQIISAEIPDVAIDSDLFQVIIQNMIHGPCGSLNNPSPCMSNGKCTKRYPRELTAETITVLHLAVHLENGQRFYFTAENASSRALSPPQTTLTVFFSLCRNAAFAKTLLYCEVPTYYTRSVSSKHFQRRKQGKPVEGHPNLYSTDALGRLYTIHPNNAECFHLRLLLVNVRGPTSFQELRTVNHEVCVTYREACRKCNFLENESHWEASMADASNTARPQKIRTLFSIILTMCFPSNPKDLWEKYEDNMSEDILHRLRATKRNPHIQFSPDVHNEALISIEDICLTIFNRTLLE